MARWVLEEAEIPIQTKLKGDPEKVAFPVAELVHTGDASPLRDGGRRKGTEEKLFRKRPQV